MLGVCFQTLLVSEIRDPIFGTATVCPCTEFKIYVKVEVDVLGSPSLISLMVSVDVKQH